MKTIVILNQLVGKIVITLFSSLFPQILPFVVYLAILGTISMIAAAQFVLKTVTLAIMIRAAVVVLKTVNRVTTPPHVKLAAASTISTQISAITVRLIWPISITL